MDNKVKEEMMKGLDSSDGEEDELTCPLCVEVMEISDKNFFPCPCGYRVCMWCWHHIRETLNGLCPACRTPYNDDPHAYTPVDQQEVVRRNKERKAKEKNDKKADAKAKLVTGPNGAAAATAASKAVPAQNVDRRNLHNYRVVQRNLVYVIGLPIALSNEEVLRKAEYFGQYGKIGKVVVHKNHAGTGNQSSPTISAYITFAHKEDAKACIQVLEGHWIEGNLLRASFGTTKYCNNFIRGMQCTNPDCVYLHELGSDEDRFTKAEIQAGHSKLNPVPGQNQQLVTGMGGPSGTGKRPQSEPILPAPVFLQDLAPSEISKGTEKLNAAPGSVQKARPAPNSWPSPNTTPGVPSDIKSANGKSWPSKGGEANDSKDMSSMGSADQDSSSIKADSDDKKGKDKGGKDENSGEDKLADAAAKKTIAQQQVSASFNGLGRCAVFTVPISSLGRDTLWAGILDTNVKASLDVNPYGSLSVPISELFDLTLPPVDAVGLQIWPKPASYYNLTKLGRQAGSKGAVSALQQVLPGTNISNSN